MEPPELNTLISKGTTEPMNDPYNVHTFDTSTTIIVISRTTGANLQGHMNATGISATADV